MRMMPGSLLFFLSFVSLPVRAEQLPPLGQRIYLLDTEKPSRPADIRPLERGSRVPGQSLMRDPLPIGASTPIDRSARTRSADAPKRISRIVFDKVAVPGRYLVPRVSFDRPLMEVGRQDEPIKVEYKKKILESERELHQFDW